MGSGDLHPRHDQRHRRKLIHTQLGIEQRADVIGDCHADEGSDNRQTKEQMLPNRTGRTTTQPSNQIESLIKAKEKRLHVLKLKESTFGISADVSLIIEIEDIEKEIEGLRKQL